MNEWIVISIIIMVVYVCYLYMEWKQKKEARKRHATVTRDRTTLMNNENIRQGVERPVPVPEITETGPMIYFANDKHRGKDREYRFNYKRVGDSWRAYILKMPSLGARDSSGIVTHRLFDSGGPYVCWDSTVNSLEDMQTISKVWADNIQEYIATGKRFG